jgi:hypothetical protein
MPREQKHGRRAFLAEATPPFAAQPVPAYAPRRAATGRYFEALVAFEPRAEPAAADHHRTAMAALAAPLVLAALLSAALLQNVALRSLLPVVLLAAAVVAIWRGPPPRGPAGPRARRHGDRQGGFTLGALPSDPRAAGCRGLELDVERLAFHAGAAPSGTLLVFDAPFGVTLLSTPRRDRMIALLSSASGTFYVGAAFDAASRRAFAPLLDRAHTIVGEDAGLEAIGPDGEPLVLAPDDLAALLDALVEQSSSCLERFVLTDARGASLTLDSRHLCVGDCAVDLDAPLEWKPIVFQEAFGQAIAVYQGTWIRQSGAEVVLVSLLPPLGPAPGLDLDLGSLDRGVLRDLRLMQASPEPPPPNEQRVAIDRLFMLPVRSALDRAPRASHQPNRAQV